MSLWRTNFSVVKAQCSARLAKVVRGIVQLSVAAFSSPWSDCLIGTVVGCQPCEQHTQVRSWLSLHGALAR